MPPAAERTDEELIAATREGDPRAFQVLVERYEARVAAVVVSMLGRGPDADDVGQETFIRFYNFIDQFRGDASLGTYITRIAINLSLKALKRRRKWRERFFSRDVDEWQADVREADEFRAIGDRAGLSGLEDADDADALLESERSESVRRALQRLSPEHRSVVVLRILEEFSTRETAVMLGIPEGTVMSRLSRALEKLEELLGPAGQAP